MRSGLFWNITQRRLVIYYRRFGTTCRFYLQVIRSTRRFVGKFSPLKMGPKGCLEKSLTNYRPTLSNIPEKRTSLYWGADKSLARPGRKGAQKHVRDARDFNNIETRAVKFFFSCKAPKEIHAILTETLASFLPGRANDLSAPLSICSLSNDSGAKLHCTASYCSMVSE